VTVPNWLTLSRLALALLMLAALTVDFPLTKSLALFIFVLAGITDYLDGYLARTRYGVSAFGQLMDPLTDKVLICSAFVALVELRVVSAWIVVVIIAREFLVTGLRLLAATEGKVIDAGKWGKHKMIWQIVGVSVLLLGVAVRDDLLRGASPKVLADYDFVFHWVSLAIGLAVAAVTLASGVLYYLENRHLVRRRAKPPSPPAAAPAASTNV
jgi:CDP-diacylglycerol--glycerol-3-phosphate 3-phosphatidyltransferase